MIELDMKTEEEQTTENGNKHGQGVRAIKLQVTTTKRNENVIMQGMADE